MENKIPDEFMFCLWCGKSGGALTKSHFLKKTSIADRPKYNYLDSNNYCMMHLNCHMDYEKLSKHERAQYWGKKIFHNQSGEISQKIYSRVKFLLGKGEEVKVW